MGHLLYGNGPANGIALELRAVAGGLCDGFGVRTKTASSLPATMDFCRGPTREFVTVMSKRPCMRSKTPLRMLRGVVCR